MRTSSSCVAVYSGVQGTGARYALPIPETAQLTDSPVSAISTAGTLPVSSVAGLLDLASRAPRPVAPHTQESTLGVQLVSQSSRDGTAGATLYEYEYELDSTRGRKRILNTVTIFNSRWERTARGAVVTCQGVWGVGHGSGRCNAVVKGL